MSKIWSRSLDQDLSSFWHTPLFNPAYVTRHCGGSTRSITYPVVKYPTVILAVRSVYSMAGCQAWEFDNTLALPDRKPCLCQVLYYGENFQSSCHD